MYETEVNSVVGQADEVPAEIREAFKRSSANVISRTVLPWGEHCTECVWPTCYTTCDMYVAREDGKCRRFADGMVRIESVDNLSGYILKLRFKRWAKLWTIGNTRLLSIADARASEDQDLAVSRSFTECREASRASRITERYYEKKRWAQQQFLSLGEEPDYFLLECYNPSFERVLLTLTMRLRKVPASIPFEQLLEIEPGFNRRAVPMIDIKRVLNTQLAFEVEITPNHSEDALPLYFGLIDFVRDREPSRSTKLCKAVVWDLDNTVWDGTLAEDGLENVSLKPGLPELIAELDRRGILLSAVSKNDVDEARDALRRFGLDRYLLYPEFSWRPKSQGLARIAAHLDIGVDSMIFVDDSPFERAEVERGCPGITVLDATEYLCLLERPELQFAETHESRRRRKFYQVQQIREEDQARFDGDYLDFIRRSRIQIEVRRLSMESLDRAHELTQRTHQLNFSGACYTKQRLGSMIHADEYDTYVIDGKDRYGDYGTVGLCILDRGSRVITDLMFSCRIRSKRVEHAFLTWLLLGCRNRGFADVYLNCRSTVRNTQAVTALSDVGFELVRQEGDRLRFVFRENREIRGEGIVDVVDLTRDNIAES